MGVFVLRHRFTSLQGNYSDSDFESVGVDEQARRGESGGQVVAFIHARKSIIRSAVLPALTEIYEKAPKHGSIASKRRQKSVQSASDAFRVQKSSCFMLSSAC